MPYTKISQSKLSKLMKKRFENLILEGTLQPNEKPPLERALGKQFYVSRPVLQKAIQRLGDTELLVSQPGDGISVPSNLCQTCTRPIAEWLSDLRKLKYNLLKTREVLKNIVAHYAAQCDPNKDLSSICNGHMLAQHTQNNGHLNAHASPVMLP